jgi:CHAT domain-containing protein
MMVDFYKNLKNGETKDKALKRAKLKLINKDVSPFFWSAFVLYGDTRSLF